ncbi:proton-coupled zinc antiporter SLC30A9, mitochondrial-like isoform X2 [Ostrea edulis]|uniref:proton-coupled zinc antiporter SLC30A9, mitochondrial-like isoform X2 n=1 Tax=Ostrea edulis TaxID=37623 RepID=UPI00209650BF|nr:proton-coupled zinc antiporter SLC30A9, mitochondrial-like isoform X2 [Ostrea edulis]
MLLKIILQDGKLLLHKRILPSLQVLLRKHHHYLVNTTFTKTAKHTGLGKRHSSILYSSTSLLDLLNPCVSNHRHLSNNSRKGDKTVIQAAVAEDELLRQLDWQLLIKRLQHDSKTPKPKEEGVFLFRREPIYEKMENTIIYEEDLYREYGLTAKDVEGLPREKMRSGWSLAQTEDLKYGYRKHLVHTLALKKWGSEDAIKLRRLIIKREMDRKEEYANEQKNYDIFSFGFKDRQGRVISLALVVNFTVCMMKMVVYAVSMSPSMLAEFLHSLLDTANQGMIYWGLYVSKKAPDKHHPYGYASFQNITSLCSGFSFFVFGFLLSSIMNFYFFLGAETSLSLIHLGVMYLTFVMEGASLYFATRELQRKAKERNMKLFPYIQRGFDPNVVVVFMEDMAAVVGVVIASAGMTLSHVYAQPFWDTAASGCVAGLMGMVAAYLIRSNIPALVGKSIPEEERKDMADFLQRDRIVKKPYSWASIRQTVCMVTYKEQ